MEYKKTPISKKVSKEAIDKTINTTIKDVSTGRLLWAVVKRHKFGLTLTWAATITLLYIFPPLPSLVVSFIGG